MTIDKEIFLSFSNQFPDAVFLKKSDESDFCTISFGNINGEILSELLKRDGFPSETLCICSPNEPTYTNSEIPFALLIGTLKIQREMLSNKNFLFALEKVLLAAKRLSNF